MRLDVEYYYSMFQIGKPSFIPDVFMVNEIHEGQFSSIMINKNNYVKNRLIKELDYISNKHNYKKLKFIKKFLFRSILKIERFLLNILFKLFKKDF